MNWITSVLRIVFSTVCETVCYKSKDTNGKSNGNNCLHDERILVASALGRLEGSEVMTGIEIELTFI